MLAYPVRPLPEEMAAQLFCRRAFGAAEGEAWHSDVIGEAVLQCGGLPMAIEAIALEYSMGQERPRLFGTYEEGEANQLFARLHECVGRLSEAQGTALLDVARFLVGGVWGAVGAYCGEEALAALERSGLVEREGDGTVGMGVVVQAFCEAVQEQMPGDERMIVGWGQDVRSALVGALHTASCMPERPFTHPSLH